MIPHNLSLPPKPPARDVPYFGMVPIPQHDFPEQFSNFCFNSLYIRKEVIFAMEAIRAECNQLLQENRIFNVDIDEILRLEKFKQIQQSAKGTLQFNTMDQGWVGKLEKIIRGQFTEVGKGWFNIHETSKETYEFGKLKKFLTLVNFMMQDTVLTLCQESVKEFVDFILRYMPKETHIKDASEVTNVFEKKPKKASVNGEAADRESHIEEEEEEAPPGNLDEVQQVRRELDQEFNPDKDPDPLFILDLVLKQKQLIPTYSVDPKDIVTTVLQVFRDGVECLLEIPQLEPILLKHLFKTHTRKTLKAPMIPVQKPEPLDKKNKKFIPDENTWLWEAFDLIRVEMERCIQPLYEYVKTYEVFKEVNEKDPDRYVRGLDDNENTTA